MGHLCLVHLEIPVDEKWLESAGLEPRQAEREFRLLLAAKLFELGRLTLVQAAELAGMSVWAFAEALKGIGVSVLNLTSEQLAHDLRSA